MKKSGLRICSRHGQHTMWLHVKCKHLQQSLPVSSLPSLVTLLSFMSLLQKLSLLNMPLLSLFWTLLSVRSIEYKKNESFYFSFFYSLSSFLHFPGWICISFFLTIFLILIFLFLDLYFWPTSLSSLGTSYNLFFLPGRPMWQISSNFVCWRKSLLLPFWKVISQGVEFQVGGIFS